MRSVTKLPLAFPGSGCLNCLSVRERLTGGRVHMSIKVCRVIVGMLFSLILVGQSAPVIADDALPVQVRVAMPSHLRVFQPITEAVFRRAGFSPDFSYYPARRSIEIFRDGKADFEVARLADTLDGYALKADLVGPIACSRLVAFAHAADNIRINSIEDLKQYRIGIAIGNYLAESIVTRYGLTHDRAQQEFLVKMLDAKRIQILLASNGDGNAIIRAAGKAQEIVPVSKPLTEAGSFILVRPDRPEWTQRLQRQFQVEIQSGQWQKAVSSVAPELAADLTRDGKCH